jgi:hypothetical protein
MNIRLNPLCSRNYAAKLQHWAAVASIEQSSTISWPPWDDAVIDRRYLPKPNNFPFWGVGGHGNACQDPGITPPKRTPWTRQTVQYSTRNSGLSEF